MPYLNTSRVNSELMHSSTVLTLTWGNRDLCTVYLNGLSDITALSSKKHFECKITLLTLSK